MINKTVYVTQSKINSILQKVDLFKSGVEIGDLYFTDLTKILSTPELKLLALYQEMLKDPENLLLTKYVKKEYKDSKRFVYESSHPSYHKDHCCKKLSASFENFEIPVEIKQKGDDEIKKYRTFFKSNINLYHKNFDTFMAQAKMKFNLKNPPKEVDYKNSGTEMVFNATGSDIETRINELLLEMESYRKSSAEINKEISLSGYATHKVKTNDEHGNWVRKADIKGSVICIWHAYKNELKNLLKEYFRIKLNPEFKFDVNILEQLNFRACQHCCKSPF